MLASFEPFEPTFGDMRDVPEQFSAAPPRGGVAEVVLEQFAPAAARRGLARGPQRFQADPDGWLGAPPSTAWLLDKYNGGGGGGAPNFAPDINWSDWLRKGCRHQHCDAFITKNDVRLPCFSRNQFDRMREKAMTTKNRNFDSTQLKVAKKFKEMARDAIEQADADCKRMNNGNPTCKCGSHGFKGEKWVPRYVEKSKSWLFGCTYDLHLSFTGKCRQST